MVPIQHYTRKVLIADADLGDLFPITRGLSGFKNPCEITTVNDGEALLRTLGIVNGTSHASQHNALLKPDLIIIDLYMPKLYGLHALGLIKHDDRYATTPCLMISSQSTASDRREAARLGAIAFLDKQSSPSVLRENILELERILWPDHGAQASQLERPFQTQEQLEKSRNS